MTDFVMLDVLVFASVYWIVAFACVVRFARQRPPGARVLRPVSVLKPLRGDDGALYENLQSFCRQSYPDFEIVFGVADARDPAVAVVHRLVRELPDVRLRLVVDDRTCGANRKVSNLANLLAHAKHDTLVIADSDMRVGPDYLRAVVAPLEESRVGLVTCLYRGVAPGGVASRLGAMFINEWFLPSALVGTRLEPLRHAFGATIACRRTTLAMIGGFEAIADQLADDYMLGWLVSRAGFRVVLVPYVVENRIAERSLRALLLHELRWARTFRTLRPVSYFCSLFTYGIPLSAIWLALSGGGRLACVATLSHLGLRCVGRLVLYRSLGQRPPWQDIWLVPIRDVVSFAIGIGSFLGRTVRWNDERFRVRGNGRLERTEVADARTPLEWSGESRPLAAEPELPV